MIMRAQLWLSYRELVDLRGALKSWCADALNCAVLSFLCFSQIASSLGETERFTLRQLDKVDCFFAAGGQIKLILGTKPVVLGTTLCVFCSRREFLCNEADIHKGNEKRN